MPVADLSRSLQHSLFICACLVAIGAQISYDGTWSLQSFVLLPPCSLVGNSTKCCPTCLGVSNVWYGLIFTIPSLVAIPGAVATGLLIDILDLPKAALSFAIMCLIGNVSRALGTYFIYNHHVLITLYSFGQVLVELSLAGLCGCREYIGIRYFDPSKQPMVIGISYAVTILGNLIGAFVLPPIAGRFGVPAAYWLTVGVSAVAIADAIVLLFIFSFSSGIRNLEQELCAKDLHPKPRSCSDVFRNFRTFETQYWFLFFVFGIATGNERTYLSNFPLYESSLGKIGPAEAGVNMAWGYIAHVLTAFVVSGVMSVTVVQLIIIIFTQIVAAIGFLTMFFNPITCIILELTASSSFYATIKSVYGFYVPKASIGLAATLMFSNSYFFNAIFSFVVGLTFEYNSRWNGANYGLFLAISAALFSALLLCILRWRYGDLNPTKPSVCLNCRCQKSEDEETQQVIAKEQYN